MLTVLVCSPAGSLDKGALKIPGRLHGKVDFQPSSHYGNATQATFLKADCHRV